MRIAIMSRWKATCGVSLHAELLAKALMKQGVEVIVFAPTLDTANRDWHHIPVDNRDEPWVYRVYGETDDYAYPYGGFIDKETILNADYDVFVVEGYQRLPVNELRKIAPEIKKKAKLVLVVHTGYVRDLEPLMRIDWDLITVFDKRFINELIRFFGVKAIRKTKIVPYPFLVIDDVKPYRPEYAENKLLFITFGRQPIIEYLDYIRVLRKLAKKYDLVYWIIRSDRELPVKDPWIIQEVKRPSHEELFSYVLGADIHLLPKSETKAVVVSSTLAQILYTGTPTVVPNTRYFETIPPHGSGFDVVVKYELGNTIDLYSKLRILIRNKELYQEVSRRAKEYAFRYNSEKIAREYIELFKKLIEGEIIAMVIEKEATNTVYHS
ncbi:MAG: glycosyltransferase family 1 protein [Thermoprotei archaeon]